MRGSKKCNTPIEFTKTTYTQATQKKENSWRTGNENKKY